MEEEYFNEIRQLFINRHQGVSPGKMMSSAAVTYNDKVFAFFSRKKKMVFKLGKDFDPIREDYDIQVFNPFKKRPPLYGWFEVTYDHKDRWANLAEQALEKLKAEL